MKGWNKPLCARKDDMKFILKNVHQAVVHLMPTCGMAEGSVLYIRSISKLYKELQSSSAVINMGVVFSSPDEITTPHGQKT